MQEIQVPKKVLRVLSGTFKTLIARCMMQFKTLVAPCMMLLGIHICYKFFSFFFFFLIESWCNSGLISRFYQNFLLLYFRLKLDALMDADVRIVTILSARNQVIF